MRDQDILAAARETFLVEAADLLSELESSLLSLAEEPDPDAVNAAFRAAHTIKGSAGLFGLDAVVSFTHDVEAMLEQLRSGQSPVTDATVTLLLECRDQIERLLASQPDTEQHQETLSESERLQRLLRRARQGTDLTDLGPTGGESGTPSAEQASDEPSTSASSAAVDALGGSHDPQDWIVHAGFGVETFRGGFDPLSFLRYLPTVGDVMATELDTGAIPALDDLDPEACHIAAAVRLRGAKDKRSIEAVFDFVSDSIALRIVPPQPKVQEMRTLLAAQDDAGERLGALLVRVGALTEREVELCLQQQKTPAAEDAGAVDLTAAPSPEDPVTPPAPRVRLGEAAVKQGLVAPEVVQAAVERQGQLRERKAEESRFVRVQADKLDALIAMIGELVIAGSATHIRAAQQGDAALAESAARVMSLVESARDRALQLRMVPVGETFARFRRIVHEVGRSLGKEVELTITGGDAELDKSMVDQIVDPLTHLVRNALDHGLETSEERVRAGKSPRGAIALNAYHESGSIVIEVTDDGRGLSRDRIAAKAVERGLIDDASGLSDDEIFRLVFLPGFSTAEKVTDLSGRGVGMDVVRRNIEALRGSVSLASQPGRGSTVQIRLPLTLAIIDGFRVAVAGHTFIVPLEAVVECIETPPEAVALDAASGRACFPLRGEVLPLLCLRQQLHLQGPPASRRSVVVMRAGPRKVGVVVDRLLGEHQTVIKPLGRLFAPLRGISGSTILGTGAVALILDIAELAQAASRPARGKRGAAPRLHDAFAAAPPAATLH